MEVLCAYDTYLPHCVQNILSHTFDTMLHHIHQGCQQNCHRVRWQYKRYIIKPHTFNIMFWGFIYVTEVWSFHNLFLEMLKVCELGILENRMMICGWDSIQFIKKRTENQCAWQMAGSIKNKRPKEQIVEQCNTVTFSSLCLLIVVFCSKKVLESLERAQ
jgi:hypothetical protein